MEGDSVLKVCLVWHSVYSPNMGVNALTYAALWYLETLSEQLGIRFNYTLLGQGPLSRDHCSDEIEISGKRIPFKFERLVLPNIKVQNVRSWVRFLKWLVRHDSEFTANLSQYDLIFDIGEGDSFSDIYGTKRFIKLCLTKFFSLRSGKPLILLPQTIGPFEGTLSRFVANQIMQRIRYVYPRDQASLDYLQSVMPNRTFRQYLDLAFNLPYDKGHFTPGKTHVGLNISALLWHGGYTRDNMFKLGLNYRQIMEDILQLFLKKEHVVVHLIPHVVLSDDLSIAGDYVVAEQIHREMPDTVLPPAFKTPVEAKSYISGLDFLVGARMHACIAAYSSGVPVIPMAYSRKFSGLFVLSLGYPMLVDLKQDGYEQARQKICDGFENRLLLKQSILANRSVVEKSITAFHNELFNIMKDTCVI
ncbi:MAG: polysaccharide pyruvyl transferase family protein [Anaerolineae bacterium]|nr:polysaccharide pyruvyl transferase family protein [Anaerolineae bacterium]